MPVSCHPWPDNRSYAAPSTPDSDMRVSRDGCAASARDSRCALPQPTRPAGTPSRAQQPTLSSPPAPRLAVSGCTDAAQTPLQPSGARARSGPFALGNACGAVARASTSGATTTRQPTGSISESWPSASSLDAPSATTNPPGLPGQQAACGPCPRCLVSSAVRWSQATFGSPQTPEDGQRIALGQVMPQVEQIRDTRAAQTRVGQLDQRLGPVTHQVQHLGAKRLQAVAGTVEPGVKTTIRGHFFHQQVAGGQVHKHQHHPLQKRFVHSPDDRAYLAMGNAFFLPGGGGSEQETLQQVHDGS